MIKFHITLEDLRAKSPCYDPAKKLGDSWSGTLLDIFDVHNVSDEDKVWAVTRFLDEKTSRLFAVHCGREALKDVKDERVKALLEDSLNLSELFATGQASYPERGDANVLSILDTEAHYSACIAAYYARCGSAYYAARAATYSRAEYTNDFSFKEVAWAAFAAKLKEMVTEQCVPKTHDFVVFPSPLNGAVSNINTSAGSEYRNATFAVQPGDYQHFEQPKEDVTTLAELVLKYFGSKLESEEAKKLYEQALEEVRK